MTKKFKEGALTAEEKKIVKKLLNSGWRGQDILALVNIGRPHTTNSGRITGVKKDKSQSECTEEELQKFIKNQEAFDLQTGLSPVRDERLIRAREAMILAVQVFNSPVHKFKTEVFCVLSNIAWTYLCHHRLLSLGEEIYTADGSSLPLSQILKTEKLGLNPAITANLLDIKELRDKVEHHILGQADLLWRGLFQANCLNFDKVMCDWFGAKVTLQKNLSFSLQFSKPDIEQLSQVTAYDVPSGIKAFNEGLRENHADSIKESTEYEFTVVYTMVPGSKSKANIKFISPESDEGKEISNVLIKHKPADELYPFKPTKVVNLVKSATNKKFTIPMHTEAVKKYKIRPENGKPDKKKTNSKYCIYHAAHGDYTYSQAWVDLLIASQNEEKS
ncbi:DUF3644 domain-containing protein [Thioclava sp. DLFJ4-1]|uniref:DUF3644 domain-containing protein n=1 Tax=Thioclava sp. DLFJ4-1 TaxID=1915313 RepID=UPI0009CD1E61|nr:DUF3644 domain-containing protein [Thioclava sp. DLFJ4-1]OOY18042.1 hypothetical protein BMI85_03650 [Thioclava sp. DLFJ4-1]